MSTFTIHLHWWPILMFVGGVAVGVTGVFIFVGWLLKHSFNNI